MMNNDNSITLSTVLYGYIAEHAQGNTFYIEANALMKANSLDAKVLPMNIRPDDIVFTVSQMRSSKLNGAIIAPEYQEEVVALLDYPSEQVISNGYCDMIRIENGKLHGDLIIHDALAKYAEREDFHENVAQKAMAWYFYDLICKEKQEA